MVSCPFCENLSVSFQFTRSKFKLHLISCAHLAYKNNDCVISDAIQKFRENNKEFNDGFNEEIKKLKSVSEILREIEEINWQSWIEAKNCKEFVKLINKKTKQ